VHSWVDGSHGRFGGDEDWMRKLRFTEEQRLGNLKAAECPSRGDELGEIARLHVPRRHPIRQTAK
jgi:hypothetical protein